MKDDVNRLKRDFQDGFAQAIELLGGDSQSVFDDGQTLINSYTQNHRYYHDLHHIKSLVTPLRETGDDELIQALDLDGDNANQEARYNALKMITALGHDCVYQGTDGGLGLCEQILEPYAKKGKLMAVDEIKNEKHKHIARMVRKIFAVDDNEIRMFDNEGKLVAHNNELLSALVTATMLDKAGISEKDQAMIIAQIEATKAFRPHHDWVLIKNRLKELGDKEEFDISFNDKELNHAMILATHFGNEDVKNFRGEFSPFIHNAFKIAPEMDANLSEAPPTASSFMQTLRKQKDTMGVFSNISENIFHHDGGDSQYPSQETLESYQQKIQLNTQTAKDFIKLKMVSTHYLQALTAQLGYADISLQELLPFTAFPKKSMDEIDPFFKAIIGVGRDNIYTINKAGEKVCFDIGESPLTQCFMEHLGKEKMLQLYEKIEAVNANYEGKEDKINLAKCSSEIMDVFNREVDSELMKNIYETIQSFTSFSIKEDMKNYRSKIVPQTGSGQESARAY